MRKLILLVGTVVAVLGCKETPEERARRHAEAAAEYDRRGETLKTADATIAARREHYQQEQREQKARAEAEASARAAALSREQEAIKAISRGKYATMTAAQREISLREACAAADGCDRGTRRVIIATATSDSERAKLEALATKLGEPNEVAGRDFFVGEVARKLIAEGQTGVVVDGNQAAKKRLVIKGPFCNDRFLGDFLATPLGAQAKDRGFTRAQCDGSSASWGREL